MEGCAPKPPIIGTVFSFFSVFKIWAIELCLSKVRISSKVMMRGAVNLKKLTSFLPTSHSFDRMLIKYSF